MLIFLQTIDDPEERICFESIYAQYRDALYQFAFKILKNQSDAEDALQEAFFSIAKNIKTVQKLPENKRNAYLFTIVEHDAIDIIRTRKETLSLTEIENLPGIDSAELHLERNNGLQKAFAALPQRYKEVLLQKYYLGFTAKEIAAQQNINLTAAQKLIYRAKQRLAEILEENDD